MEENKEEVKEENNNSITDDDGYWVERGLVAPKYRSPNGVIGDVDKQQKAWDNYVRTWREGKPNAYQAGLAAGYTNSTAKNLSNFKWFKEKKDKLRRSRMMSNAERNLSRILNLDYSKIKILPDGSQIEGIDNDTLRIVADISKTIVTTLGKDVGYSTKTEIGGGMNSEINIKSISYADPIQPVQIENTVVNTVVDEGIKQLEETQEKIVEEIIERNN